MIGRPRMAYDGPCDPPQAPLFDPAAYGRRLQRAMAHRNASYGMVGLATGISRATVHRIALGHPPSVENYLRINAWIETDAGATKSGPG